MELDKIIEQLKNPRNPYDPDLKALRFGLLSLLEKNENSESEPTTTQDEQEQKPKRGRKPKTEE